ncbi:MAG: serine/threonine protein kinase [Verrucomicrobiales bacterium]|jgi:serine/threonine protein kinase
MNDMTQCPQCPNCNEPIAPDAPGGICPKCVAAGAIPPLLEGDESASTSKGSWQPAAPMTTEQLDAILTEYTVEEILGAGGMGVVYRAVQKNLNREVAIKVMPRELAEDPAFVERFSREAKALAALNHPHIVTVHDTGTIDGICYIVMELVDGANLREVLAAGKLQPQEALAIVTQVCAALQFAHDSGIVHRDIKPENILLTHNGHVKITDFGLVKLLGERDLQVTLTQTRESMGSVRYMAPEQMAGAGDADHRADIYSLGVVFYELLTGEVPAGRFDPPSSNVQIDVRLDEVVMRALDFKPERRYQQASEVSTEVESINRSSPQLQSAQPSVEPARRISKKAVIGAAWAPLFLIPSVPLVIAASYQLASEDNTGFGGIGLIELLIILLIGFPCFLAPIGCTLLGISAIKDINSSQGRIYGLPLAFIDAVLFPLLAIAAALVILAMNLLGTDFVPVVAVIAIIVCGFIAVMGWKKVKRLASNA